MRKAEGCRKKHTHVHISHAAVQNGNDERNLITIRVSRITIAANFMLAALKASAGVFGHSDAMIADALHAFSDLLGSAAVLAGAYITRALGKRGKNQVGVKIEGGISFALSLLLFYLAFEIGMSGVKTIISGGYESSEIPTMLPLAAAAVSICVKEILYRYSIAGAEKADSVALRALAWHSRADAFVTVGSLIGILGARLGYKIFDPAASIIISILVLKAAFEILSEAIRTLRK